MARFGIFNYTTWKDVEFDSIVDARAYAIKQLSKMEYVSDNFGREHTIHIRQGKQNVGYVYAHGPKERRSYWYHAERHPGRYYESKELYKNGKIINPKRKMKR